MDVHFVRIYHASDAVWMRPPLRQGTHQCELVRRFFARSAPTPSGTLRDTNRDRSWHGHLTNHDVVTSGSTGRESRSIALLWSSSPWYDILSLTVLRPLRPTRDFLDFLSASRTLQESGGDSKIYKVNMNRVTDGYGRLVLDDCSLGPEFVGLSIQPTLEGFGSDINKHERICYRCSFPTASDTVFAVDDSRVTITKCTRDINDYGARFFPSVCRVCFPTYARGQRRVST
jgi:hypothetical protein